MDRRWILLPAVAITAGAQTPGTSEAEQTLRSRAKEFFDYQVAQKYRQAEDLVADESKDDYYAARKPQLEGFMIRDVQFFENGSKAKVTIIAKTTVNMIGAGPTKFEVPSPSSWKLQKDKWVWYLDKDEYRKTPFGESQGFTDSAADPAQAFASMKGSAPTMEQLRELIQVNPKSLDLVAGGPPQKVVVKNGLQGVLDFKIGSRPTPIPGLTIAPNALHLAANESGEFVFQAASGAKFEDTVMLLIEPFGLKARLQIRTAQKK